MGGVDKLDQMMTLYDVERKRVKKWYNKLFNHLINQCAFNAHGLHKAKGGTLNDTTISTRIVEKFIQEVFYTQGTSRAAQ